MRPFILPLSITALFLLACSGVTDSVVDGGTDEEEEVEEEEELSADEKLQGSWALLPGDDAMRRYKIMRAACSGKKKALQKLGGLDDSEKRTFDYYEEQPKETKEAILQLIKNMQDTRYTFEDGKVSWTVADTEIAKKDYTIESEDPLHVKLEYAGTTQHWYIEWSGDDKAKVDVQYEGSDLKMEHNLRRK